jgi:hypothetical protein
MLKFDNEMYRFLEFASRGSVIAQILMNGDSKLLVLEGNFISKVEKEIDMVSFLPVSKFEKVDDVWHKGRTPMKIGRFLRKFLNEYSIKNYEIDDVQIEKFVNTFKSYFSRDTSKLKIVEGKDILKYYQEDSYHTNGYKYGSLWNSCMRQTERNKFMKLYADNIDKVKMLVFFDDEERIRARALLWDGVRDHNDKDVRYKFMDRIYSFYDHDVDFFKDWAKDNGYITKWEQSAKSERDFDLGDKVHSRMSLYVKLENTDQIYYPYLDTFKFYNVDKKRFSSSDGFKFDYVLIQSNGAVEREEEEPDEEEPEYWGDSDDDDQY